MTRPMMALLEAVLAHTPDRALVEERSRGCCAQLRTVRKGEHIFHDRDEVRHVYFVVSGMLSVYKIAPMGERRVIFALGPGEMVNETAAPVARASASCQALSESCLLVIETAALLESMRGDFNLTLRILELISNKTRRLYRQLKNSTGSLRGDKRLAAKLWKLALDYGVPCDDGVRIDIKLSVTYLAGMLGVQRESLSRTLGALTSRGLVELKDGKFVIPSKDALAAYFKSGE